MLTIDTIHPEREPYGYRLTLSGFDPDTETRTTLTVRLTDAQILLFCRSMFPTAPTESEIARDWQKAIAAESAMIAARNAIGAGVEIPPELIAATRAEAARAWACTLAGEYLASQEPREESITEYLDRSDTEAEEAEHMRCRYCGADTTEEDAGVCQRCERRFAQ